MCLSCILVAPSPRIIAAKTKRQRLPLYVYVMLPSHTCTNLNGTGPPPPPPPQLHHHTCIAPRPPQFHPIAGCPLLSHHPHTLYYLLSLNSLNLKPSFPPKNWPPIYTHNSLNHHQFSNIFTHYFAFTSFYYPSSALRLFFHVLSNPRSVPLQVKTRPHFLPACFCVSFFLCFLDFLVWLQHLGYYLCMCLFLLRKRAPFRLLGTAVFNWVDESGGGRGELGYGGYRAPPFTDVQLKELEQQAMIYKYLMAGLQVPPDLVRPIRHSFEGLPAHIFNHPALGYCSYYGKKFDPEPGRCRRTDGKKWRCSKDAHPDSKYCERHMHRGRNRSRKPVESQSTSQSLLTAAPLSNTGLGINRGTSQQMPLYSSANSEGSSVGSNATKLQMGPISYGINSREISFSQETSGRVGSLDLGASAGSGSWGLAPCQVSSSSLFKQGSDSRLLGNPSAQQYITHAFEPINSSFSKQQQQGLFGSDIGSPTTLKQEHLFFSDWPTTKETWSNLDNNVSSQNVFSSTQLSMSIPRESSDFALGTAYSTNNG